MEKLLIIAALIWLLGCEEYEQDLPVETCLPAQQPNAYTNSMEVESLMDKLLDTGIPGMVVTIYTEEGWWGSARGLVKLEEDLPMELCHLQYLQSISKTYMAVAILQLYEQGRIDLDAPITTYLDERYSKNISEAHKITIRMLLNHTSGIPEYNNAPSYVTQLLQNPDRYFTPLEYLEFVDGKSLDFGPGTKYSYRNTNYLLLALIADAITGDHAKFMADNIFSPLGLSETYYRNDPEYLTYPHLANGYWDRYSNSIVENVSQMQRINVSSLIGDDGIVCTPRDAVSFLRGLFEGRLLNESTLQEMQTWVRNKDGEFAYGLGLDYDIIEGEIAHGHSGGGLGAGCQLLYFPNKELYVFMGINLGTVTDSPIHDKAEPILDEMYRVLLQ